MTRRPMLPLLALLALFALAACADDGKKFRKSCGADTDCDGGVCFAQQCYEACTSKDDCGDDEICVWKNDGDRDVSLCVVAADQAGCTDDLECEGTIRVGACEQAGCSPATGVCDALPLDGCVPEDECGDDQCTGFETCSDCADDCPCDGTCLGGVCSTDGGGPRFTECNEGTLELTATEPDGLPFDAAGLPTLGVLGMVGEPGDDVSIYLWLKSSPARLEDVGGDAIVLFLSLPAESPEGSTFTPDGIAIVNGKGVIGVDAEYLQIDQERSTVTWTGGSLAAGSWVTGTLDLYLATTCGPARHQPHLQATFQVTLRSVMEIVGAQTNCLELLTSALSFPAMQIGKLEITVDGQPLTVTNGQATAQLYPENGTLSLTGYGADQPMVSLQAYDLVLGAQKATLSVTTSHDDSSCSWQAEPEGALTLTAPSGTLSEGPVTGTFEGTVPLLEYADPTCAPASHTVSGSFTAALCW